MKRALFLFLAIAVAMSLLVIPAFASESYVFYEAAGNFFLDSSLPLGKYEVFLWVCDDSGVVIRKDSLGVVLHEGNYLFPRSVSPDGVEYTYEIYEEYDSDSGSYTFLGITSGDDYVFAPYVEFIPYVEPVTMDTFLGGVGEFFTSATQWLGDVLKIVVNSPALTVAVLAMPIILIAITFLVKIKSL